VYDSRHGFTERCLGLLSGEVPPGVDLWPVRSRPGVPEWSDYDAVVFGGPVYFGRWAPAVLHLITSHLDRLKDHPKVGAFVVSLSPKAAALRYFGEGLPPALKGRLGHVACFGGGVEWKSLAWWEKLVLKRNRGIETDASNLDLPAIHALAAWLTAKTPAP